MDTAKLEGQAGPESSFGPGVLLVRAVVANAVTGVVAALGCGGRGFWE